MTITRDPKVIDWDKKPVPMSRWGKDHWSTLAYAESRAVDHSGVLDGRHMRADGQQYPTYLRALYNVPQQLRGHTDWDCLRDMQEAGLLVKERGYIQDRRWVSKEDRDPNKHYLFAERVIFTDFGLEVAGRLRTHKANGGNYATFTYEG